MLSTGNLLLDLGYLNLLLGAFNLLPAFPMDGGRVLRALLAERMKFTAATKYASYIGRILGIGMAVFGILFPGYFLWIVVGVFVYVGASEEAEQTIVSTTLANVRVKDVMQSEIGSVRPEQTLAEAFEVMFQIPLPRRACRERRRLPRRRHMDRNNQSSQRPTRKHPNRADAAEEHLNFSR